MATVSIIQWNAQGITNKKNELAEMIRLHNANISTIQETKLWNYSKFSFPHFTALRKDGNYNKGPHGGVALYINSSIPFQPIELNTPLQAVAASVQINVRVTLCHINHSRSHVLNQQLLNQLFSELPQPCLIAGDFNAYNALWGSNDADERS